MGISPKINQGTARSSGPHLCRSCANGTYMTDARGERFICSGLPRDMQPRGIVSECGSYSDPCETQLSEMYATAWELRPGKGKGHVMGFRPPKCYDEDDD